MENQTCPNCGAQLHQAKRFCPECGVRLDDPLVTPPNAPIPPAGGAATVLLPPPDAPSPRSPTVRLEPEIVPTTRLDQSEPPARSAGETPTFVGAPAPIPAVETSLPPWSAASSTPAGAGVAQAAAPQNRRTLWWLVGGIGCLGLFLLAACAGLVLFTLRNADIGASVPTAVATPAEPVSGGIVPDDAPIAGGNVLLDEDFERPNLSSLGEDEDESSRYSFEDGTYIIEVKKDNTLVWSLVDGSYKDVAMSLETAVRPGSDTAAYGLVFHYQDANNFYLFSISSDGYYALELLQNDEWITLIDWTQSDEIDAVRNTMRVETRADRIKLFINDLLLEETSDGTFTSGEVGPAVSSFDTSATIRFDNLRITRNE